MFQTTLPPNLRDLRRITSAERASLACAGVPDVIVVDPTNPEAVPYRMTQTEFMKSQTLDAPVLTAPASTSTGLIITKQVLFSETASAVSHTASIAIPAGAVLHGIRVIAGALWGAGAAVLKVGDTADDDGYFTGVNLKATDLLVGEVLDTTNSSLWGGKEGAYLVAATGRRGPTTDNFGSYYAAGSNIVATVTVTTPAVTTGRTVLVVTYSTGEAVTPTVA